MVIASLVGFMCSAQFVSLERLEVPYYVALLGASALKLYSHADANLSSPASYFHRHQHQVATTC